VAELPLLDLARSLRETCSDIADKALPLLGCHEPEELAGLGVVVRIVAVVVARNGSAHLLGPLDVALVFSRSAEAVGFVVGRGSAVIVEAHRAVAVVGGEGALRTIHGEGVVVNAKAIAVRIRVGDQTRLQHLVWRIAHARDDVARLEGCLLDFSEVVDRVAIERHLTDFDQRIVTMRPNLGEVERVDVVGLRYRT
jgi:hypothetical protein